MNKTICLTCDKKETCKVYKSTKKTNSKILKCRKYKGVKI